MTRYRSAARLLKSDWALNLIGGERTPAIPSAVKALGTTLRIVTLYRSHYGILRQLSVDGFLSRFYLRVHLDFPLEKIEKYVFMKPYVSTRYGEAVLPAPNMHDHIMGRTCTAHRASMCPDEFFAYSR